MLYSPCSPDIGMKDGLELRRDRMNAVERTVNCCRDSEKERGRPLSVLPHTEKRKKPVPLVNSVAIQLVLTGGFLFHAMALGTRPYIWSMPSPPGINRSPAFQRFSLAQELSKSYRLATLTPALHLTIQSQTIA